MGDQGVGDGDGGLLPVGHVALVPLQRELARGGSGGDAFNGPSQFGGAGAASLQRSFPWITDL